MRGAYHLTDKISNAFCMFLLFIFLAITLILPLDIEASANTNTRGFPAAPYDRLHRTKTNW